MCFSHPNHQEFEFEDDDAEALAADAAVDDSEGNDPLPESEAYRDEKIEVRQVSESDIFHAAFQVEPTGTWYWHDA